MNEKRVRIGEILRKEMERQKMTRYRLAKLTGTQIKTVNEILSADKNFKIDTLISFVEALGISITVK